jgi:hypothetical protein
MIRFKFRGQLILHLKNHEKVYKCEHCRKRFSSASLCVSHERTHVKPTKCKFCGKLFYKKIVLRKHEKSCAHRDEFKCRFCKKAVFQKNACVSSMNIASTPVQKPLNVDFVREYLKLSVHAADMNMSIQMKAALNVDIVIRGFFS